MCKSSNFYLNLKCALIMLATWGQQKKAGNTTLPYCKHVGNVLGDISINVMPCNIMHLAEKYLNLYQLNAPLCHQLLN